MVLLSATMTDSERLRAWLHPCDHLETHVRHPPLHHHLLPIGPDVSIDDQIETLVTREVLSTPGRAVLIFVHRRADTERLAARLPGARAYHAGMDAEARTAVASGVLTGAIRVVVSTTALAMGVDLPVSHVIVRDTTFPGDGPLPAAIIAQMLGRAGRGEDDGHGFVLLRPTDDWATPSTRHCTGWRPTTGACSHATFEATTPSPRWRTAALKCSGL
jgi:helicase